MRGRRVIGVRGTWNTDDISCFGGVVRVGVIRGSAANTDTDSARQYFPLDIRTSGTGPRLQIVSALACTSPGNKPYEGDIYQMVTRAARNQAGNGIDPNKSWQGELSRCAAI